MELNSLIALVGRLVYSVSKPAGIGVLACSAVLVTAAHSAPATFSSPQSLSGSVDVIETWGVSAVDLNNDYCVDLFFGNHRLQPSLYLGNCDGTFEDRSDLVVGDDVNVDAHTTVFGDFQNKGCSDAHISVGGTNASNHRHASQYLLGESNLSGECTGQLTRQVGSEAEYPEQRGRSSVPVDVDYDGDLDLVATGYSSDSQGSGGPEAVFLNDGAGELTQAPQSLAGEFDGHSLTVFNILANLDGDSELDLICGETVFPNAECSKDIRASFATGSLLSQDLSLDVISADNSMRRSVADAFAADLDGDGDNDLVALRRAVRSGNAARIENNTVVEGLNTTSAQAPMRCLSIPGEVNIESLVITGDYADSNDIKFGQNAVTRNRPNTPGSSVRRYDFGSISRANNAGISLPNTADGVDENERGTYIGYVEADQLWRICDVTGFRPNGVTVTPSPRRLFNKYAFRIEFSGAVGELIHEDYDPEEEPLVPAVWINNGDSGNGTQFENTPLNGGISEAITAFGLGEGDFDNDGDIDFVASYENHGTKGDHYLYTNDGNGNFEQSRFDGCPTGIAESIAVADVNDDGRLDTVISCAWFGVAHKTNHAHSVWLNNTDNSNRAIMFNVVGNNANREGIGAQIRVTDANDRTQTLCSRDVGNTLGRGSQDSEFVHCGVATRTSVDVIVNWPGDLGQNIYNNINTAAFYRLEEGSNSVDLIKTFATPTVDLPIVEVSYTRVQETDGSARVLVRLEGSEVNNTGANIEVDFESINDTAVAGLDYTGVSGRATIAPGRRFFVIDIPVLTDNISEPTERFNVVLSNPSGATINPVGGVVQINNN